MRNLKLPNKVNPDMVTDPEVFMMLMNEARMNSGGTKAFSDEAIELYRTPSYREACSTDWFDELFKTGATPRIQPQRQRRYTENPILHVSWLLESRFNYCKWRL